MLKTNAIKKLNISIKKYDQMILVVQGGAENLFDIRKNSSKNVIMPVENFINTLANSPKQFDKSFALYKAEFKVFNDLIDTFKAESTSAEIRSNVGAGAGIVAGVGTVALMPAAAMAIATTFGTASTGAAIAGLSGAAATNAALAWLGGGALVAGGGGMAGGAAFLSLAGPIGIGIGAVGVIGSGLYASSKNKEIAVKADQQRANILTAYTELKAAHLEIDKMISLTDSHNLGVKKLLINLTFSAPKDYNDFTEQQKEKLGALINHIESLAKLLNKKVA
jgi:hypothetical protein